MRLTFEVEGEGAQRGLPGDGAALVAFMSFAVMRGFGAQHPLIALAERLDRTHKVRLGPLTTFYGAEPEDAEDRSRLEMVWQPAGELREAIEQLLAVLETDSQAQALARRGEAEGLREQAESLLPALRAAEQQHKRVRLGFVL